MNQDNHLNFGKSIEKSFFYNMKSSNNHILKWAYSRSDIAGNYAEMSGN
jgi:hypothetical protein